ncbi:MAG: hypothetical protein CW338_06825 [Clostridiales bacterium]|nr:hypothetical protein [Clostridiales bacterium]
MKHLSYSLTKSFYHQSSIMASSSPPGGYDIKTPGYLRGIPAIYIPPGKRQEGATVFFTAAFLQPARFYRFLFFYTLYSIFYIL